MLEPDARGNPIAGDSFMLLLNGHDVGTRIRTARAEHRQLVDVDLDEQGTDEKCDVGTSDRRQLAAGVLRLFEGKTE